MATSKLPKDRRGVNRNLLDNWYFAGGGSQQGSGIFPINQRGQTSYNNEAYSFDRWKFLPHDGGTVTLQSGYITIEESTPNSADPPGIAQIVYAPLGGCVVTVSILTTQGLASVTSSALSTQVGDAWQITNHFFNSAVWCGLRYLGGAWQFAVTTSGASIIAVKMEIGSDQTLAHLKNGAWVLNEVPDYWEEFAECERYLKQISGGIFLLMSSWDDGTSLQIPFELWYGLRHKPTAIIKSGNYYAINPANVSQALLISVNAEGDGFTSPTALATRTAIPVFSTSANNRLLFSAES